MRALVSGRFEEACRHEGFCPANFLPEIMTTKHCKDGCCPDCGRIFLEEHPKEAERMKDLLVTWVVDIPDTYRASHLGGKCCWKCQSYDIRAHECATHNIQIHGDAGHVCDRFTLDRTRYATLSKQAWEVRGKALQATMEDF